MQKNHLQVRLINTQDLGIDFEHYFILVKDGNTYYIADLTYEQFNSSLLNNLLLNGYILVDNKTLNEYLSIINKKEINGFTCDNLFYMEITNKKR